MNYRDFDIDLREQDGLHYQVVVRAPGGATASAIVAFPFTNAALENYLLRLENAILRSTGRRRQPQTEEEHLLQAFGQQMFDFLLTGEARALYYESLRDARHQHGLRLRLHIGSAALALLPWEFLYDPRRGDYVCLNPYTSLVRYLDLPHQVQPLSVTPPLRILGMVANPTDLQALDVGGEKASLERALDGLKARGLVELTWLPGDTAQELQRFMRTTAGPWHIFHFIGHGGFDATRREGVLYVADEQRRSRALSATQLSRILAGQRYALRLVVLNACEGARGGREDILSSTAATLVRSEIPAVLAMQYDITDSAAVAFAQSFYEAITDGLPVDTAVTDARNAVSLANEQSLEWGTPVLYLWAQDGRIFEVQSPPKKDLVRTPKTGRVWQWTMGIVILLLMTMSVLNWRYIGPLFGFGSDSPPPPTVMANGTHATETPSGAVAVALSSTFTATDTPQPTVMLTLTPTLPEAPIRPSVTAIATNTPALATATPVPPDTPTDTPIPTDTLLPPTDTFTPTDTLIPTVQPRLAQPDAGMHLFTPTDTPIPIVQPTLMAGATQIVDDIVYVYVPAGEFAMGSSDEDKLANSDEKPQHPVYVDAFWMMQTEVTNAHYQRCVEAGECSAPNNSRWNDAQYAKHPVTNVTWQQARTYAEWVGGRLPTEAEWEKACRSTDRRVYPWGNEAPDESRLNYESRVDSTAEVGSYPPGAYGLYDMAGNVWEWTADWYNEIYYEASPERNPTGPAEGTYRMLRGGSWDDLLDLVRCANRNHNNSVNNFVSFGFRVVVSSPGF